MTQRNTIRRVRNTAAAIIERSDGSSVLYSYRTPVAAFVPGLGYMRTEEYFSVTTSRHANEFAGSDSPKVPHAGIVAIADGLPGSDVWKIISPALRKDGQA